MKMRKLIVLFSIFVCGLSAAGQVQFEAKVSKDQLGINERLRIDFEMNQDGDNFRPPSFEGFRIVGGPNQSISNSWVNGKRSFSKTYSYFLAPLKRGTLTIGQATIEIEGSIYKTSPVEVEITAAVEAPKDGSNPDYIASENVHLVAEVSNTNPYLNEAITVTYKLYVSHDVSITSHWREIDIPKYTDFWSQNIDNPQQSVREGKYKGKDYRYVVLKSTVLYPQKVGELEIEPLTLDVPIDVPGTKRDFFGRRLSERVNRTISAGRRTIEVKPLPEEGKPEGFGGAVGQFEFSVTPDKTSLGVNETLLLDVKVSGKGNLKLFKTPAFKLPGALEVYEPEHSESITTNHGGMQGSILDTYTIVPQFEGEYRIQPFSFSYFDPRTETYKTLSSEGFTIEVEGSPLAAASGKKEDPADRRPVTSSENFKFIKLQTRFKKIDRQPFFRSPWFWSLVSGPILLLPVFLFAGKKRKEYLADAEGNKLRKANRMARKYLSEARKNTADPARFYEALEQALHNYLRAKLNIETSEMKKSLISEMLTQREVETKTVEVFIDLLKSCEFARYASASGATVEKDYEQAVEVILSIDKQIR